MEKKPHTESIDLEIIRLLQSRDKEAVRKIYHAYGGTLLGVISRIVRNPEVAEDVLQDAMVSIWKYASRYDATKGRLFTWMLNICRNRAIDYLRSKEYKKTQMIQGDENLVVNHEATGSLGFNPDMIGLRETLTKLEPEYAEVIQTVYYGGYTHQEASKKLNLPLGTLKSRLRIAIRELRKLLIDERK